MCIVYTLRKYSYWNKEGHKNKVFKQLYKTKLKFANNKSTNLT